MEDFKFRNNINAYFQTACLFILTITIFFSVPVKADFGWFEAGRHAMDGLFYYDLLLDWGLFSPVQYAQIYYQHYPAITPVMYPPFFGFCEAVGFALIGPYPWVARLTVIVFLLFGALGLIKLTEDFIDKKTAFYAGLIYISFPITIYWSRDVMLEVPAMALVIWSFYFFIRYLREAKTKDIILSLLFAVLAPYTKQNTIFIFPVLVTTAALSRKFYRIWDRRFLLGLILAIISGVPLAFVTFKWGMVNLKQSMGTLQVTPMSKYEHVLFYINNLPTSVGWPVLILVFLSCFVVVFKKYRNRFISDSSKLYMALFVSWSIFCYFQMVLIKIKEPRHGFFWIPLFAIFASLGLIFLTAKIKQRKLKICVELLFIIVIFTWNFANCKMNWSEGFYAPAQYLKNNWDGTAVLTNISRDASFIFHIRSLDNDRKYRVYRSSKIFERSMIFKKWGVVSFIENKEQLLTSLSEYGIRYILLEKNMSHMTQVEFLLREIVKNDKFEKVKQFPITYPDNELNSIILYKYKEKIFDPGNIPVIHLPVVGMEIKNSY